MLYFLVNGTFGGRGYGLARNNMAYLTDEGYANRNTLDHPFWTAERPSNIYPSYNFSDNERLALQSYGFVRLQEVNLSYNFNPAFLQKARISALKLYVSGSNLFLSRRTGSAATLRSEVTLRHNFQDCNIRSKHYILKRPLS